MMRNTAEGCAESPTAPINSGARKSCGSYQGQSGEADSDSFQGPKQSGNRSSVLLVLGKGACRS